MPSDPDVQQEKTVVDTAEEFLLDLLKDGPMLAKEIQGHYRQAGLSVASVRRAKVRLGIIARRLDHEFGEFAETELRDAGKKRNGNRNAPWVWMLPPGAQANSPGAQNVERKNDEHLGNGEHLDIKSITYEDSKVLKGQNDEHLDIKSMTYENSGDSQFLVAPEISPQNQRVVRNSPGAQAGPPGAHIPQKCEHLGTGQQNQSLTSNFGEKTKMDEHLGTGQQNQSLREINSPDSPGAHDFARQREHLGEHLVNPDERCAQCGGVAIPEKTHWACADCRVTWGWL